MKIVNFTPGLGNQLFEYIFVQYLKQTFPKEKVYGYYYPKFLNKHNGLEVHKMFDIELPPETTWSKSVAFLCRFFAKIIPSIKATDQHYSEQAVYYDGWWQDKRFFLDTIETMSFRVPVFDDINTKLIEEIINSESVSLHVRRGDYLEAKNAKEYGGICTLEYYNKALDVIKSKFNNPKLFVFSNDIEWCTENLPLDKATFVSNNTGANSWLDMFLMSQCKANILANSSFSYWGAMLNKNDNLVVYPGKWVNTKKPNIFPNNWIDIF